MPRVFDNPDHSKARTFFRRVLRFDDPSKSSDIGVVAIVHIVDSAIPFLPVLDEKFKVLGYMGKPSSIQSDPESYLSAALPDLQHVLDKNKFRKNPSEYISDILPRRVDSNEDIPSKLVLLDIGGYFTSIVEEGNLTIEQVRDSIASQGYTLIGIVEDTQNGHARYNRALSKISSKSLDFTVISVAESPLKSPENHLVGVAITFSIEAILRQSNVVLQSRRAGVIGFGPIGMSVAHSLRSRGINVAVCEKDPIRLAQAAAQGFPTYRFKYGFEDFSKGLNLIVSATGAGAHGFEKPINSNTVRYLTPGTFVASVTSQDDEIDLESIKELYDGTPLRFNSDVTRWVRLSEDTFPEQDNMGITLGSPSFYLMAEGNAVNFKHSGVVGPAIQLLQGEILAAIDEIVNNGSNYSDKTKVHELPEKIRVKVANAWLDQYLLDSAVSEFE